MVILHRIFTCRTIWMFLVLNVVFTSVLPASSKKRTEHDIQSRKLARDLYYQLEAGIVKKAPELKISPNSTAQEQKEALQDVTLALLVNSAENLKALANIRANPKLAGCIASTFRNSTKVKSVLQDIDVIESPLPAMTKLIEEFANLFITKY
uniref:Uncharacterized protein n=1 Tax=Homalodisca liturata TaxID=320908 RepID=A0A1B6J8N5_9HEMI